MKNLLICVFVLSLALSAIADSVEVVSANATHLRAFEAQWFPSVDPRILELVGIEENADPKNLQFTEDVVSFIITDFNETALYFGYFHAVAQFESGKGNNTNDSLSSLAEAAFAVVLRSYVCFEYVDNNGIPGYQTNTSDQMTGYYDLSSLALEWAPMQIDSFNVTDDAGHTFKVFSITIQTMDQVYLMRFLTAETEVKVGNITIDSNTMKIDFEIRWFTPLHVQAPWTTGPSNATQYPNAEVGLALFVEAVYTSVSVSLNKTGYNTSNNGQSSVSLAAGGVTGEFSWVTKAATTIQGQFAIAAVHVNIAGAGSEITENVVAEAELLLFSFNGSRPSLVSWDPTLGGKPTNSTATTGMSMPMTSSMPPMDMTTAMDMKMTSGIAAISGAIAFAPCFVVVALAILGLMM
jgi:hypothetical protein